MVGWSSVWWDGLLEGGERFSRKTAAALEAADVVVVLWSKTSVESHWVHDEATHGRDKGRLVPVSIDGSEAPLGFRQFQVLDLAHWKGKADAPEIADVVRAIGIAAGQPDLVPRPVPAIATPTSRRNLILAGSSAALVAAGGGAAAWKWGLFEPAGIANSVAVLPFKNLSGDPKQDYFSDGLAEEIRAALARNSLLKVTATTSAATFKERTTPLPEIAKQLGVAHILDGNVRRFGETVRIGVQLINGSDGATGWSRTFEEPFSDLFEMQSRIAQTVSQVLTAQATGAGFSQGEDRFSSSGGTSNAEAFDAYLQGFAAFDRGRVADNYLAEYAKSLPHFDRAIALDPNYAAAFAGRARYYIRVGQIKDDRSFLRRGFEDAQKCIDLAPDFADGYAVKGYAWLFYKLNVSGADKYYQRARELGWGDVKALMGYQGYCSGWWKFKEAEEAIQRMLALDPLSFPVQMRLVELRINQGRNDEALEIIERHWAEGNKYSQLNYWAAYAHLSKKEFSLARANAVKLSDDFDKASTLVDIYRAEGNRQEFEKSSLELIKQYGEEAIFLNCVYLAYIDEPDRALTLLESMYSKYKTNILSMRDDETLEEKLGDHPRYIALYQKLGLAGKPATTN